MQCRSTDILVYHKGEKRSDTTDPRWTGSWVGHGPPYGGWNPAYGIKQIVCVIHLSEGIVPTQWDAIFDIKTKQLRNSLVAAKA